MLERARREVGRGRVGAGDALALPFEDASFDAATVGFGVRNLADLERGLAELRRVLRPGGRLAILEITQPRGAAARRSTGSGSTASCRCSARSFPAAPRTRTFPPACAAFPAPTSSPALLRGAGFEDVRWRTFAGGIVALHIGVREVSLATIRETPGPRRLPRGARGAAGRGGRLVPGARRRGRRRSARGRRQAAAAAARLPRVAVPARRRSRPAPRSSSCTWRRSSTTT